MIAHRAQAECIGHHPIPQRAGGHSVGRMIRQLFAVERYARSGSEPPAAPGAVPGLVGALYLPADEVVVALVEGADAEAVRAAVSDAGWRVDRITPAEWIAPPAFDTCPGGQP